LTVKVADVALLLKLTKSLLIIYNKLEPILVNQLPLTQVIDVQHTTKKLVEQVLQNTQQAKQQISRLAVSRLRRSQNMLNPLEYWV
jgi:hypothetical protein